MAWVSPDSVSLRLHLCKPLHTFCASFIVLSASSLLYCLLRCVRVLVCLRRWCPPQCCRACAFVLSSNALSLFTTCALVWACSGYNIALFFISPVAGALAERLSVRGILTLTTLARMVIYALLIPACWVVLQSGWLLAVSRSTGTLFFSLFLVLICVDGAVVSFSNVVDIDCGGTDLLAQQVNLTVQCSACSVCLCERERLFLVLLSEGHDIH